VEISGAEIWGEGKVALSLHVCLITTTTTTTTTTPDPQQKIVSCFHREIIPNLTPKPYSLNSKHFAEYFDTNFVLPHFDSVTLKFLVEL
jgi:hypothetical protein